MQKLKPDLSVFYTSSGQETDRVKFYAAQRGAGGGVAGGNSRTGWRGPYYRHRSDIKSSRFYFLSPCMYDGPTTVLPSTLGQVVFMPPSGWFKFIDSITYTPVLTWTRGRETPPNVITECLLHYCTNTGHVITAPSTVTDDQFVNLTLWRPLLSHGYSYKASCASFVIFDIWALWRSALSVRVPWCQKLQMMA